jgi:hypothetical protein
MIKKTETKEPETKEQETERVKAEIDYAFQLCAQMGGNDIEKNFLDDLFRRYVEDDLTAEQAITQARAVPENKIQR